jgi:hypothetical protein
MARSWLVALFGPPVVSVSQSKPIVLTVMTVVDAVCLALAPSYDYPEACRLPSSNHFQYGWRLK